MKYIVLIIVTVFVLVNAAPVQASTTMRNYTEANNIKRMDLLPPEHAKVGVSCDNWRTNGWIVELRYYANYQDYLSDYAHYFEQYPDTCYRQPEKWEPNETH